MRWLLFLAACHASHPKVEPGRIFRFDIGALHAVALYDGEIAIPNDGKTLGVGHSTKEVGALVGDKTSISIQPLLVLDGDRTLLFDTGARDATWAKAGHLPQSLALAGVAPAQITDIFISHGDPDHVGGLVTNDFALAFPNAVIHISEPEWAAMQAHPEEPKLVAAVAAKVVPFEPGAQLLPDVRAVDTRGHTPGHSSYEIAHQLFFLGDVAHHVVVSVQRPDWVISYDQTDGAMPMREQTLAALAASGEQVFAGHFPFPGLGKVVADGETYKFVTR